MKDMHRQLRKTKARGGASLSAWQDWPQQRQWLQQGVSSGSPVLRLSQNLCLTQKLRLQNQCLWVQHYILIGST
jgi:hypothetical protein